MTVMGIAQERTERLEALRGLIERLSAPDLTLADAKVLRGRVADLLEPADRRLRHDPPAPSPTVIPSSDRREIWSADSSIRMAV
jgi:hypothetical protein